MLGKVDQIVRYRFTLVLVDGQILPSQAYFWYNTEIASSSQVKSEETQHEHIAVILCT